MDLIFARNPLDGCQTPQSILVRSNWDEGLGTQLSGSVLTQQVQGPRFEPWHQKTVIRATFDFLVKNPGCFTIHRQLSEFLFSVGGSTN